VIGRRKFSQVPIRSLRGLKRPVFHALLSAEKSAQIGSKLTEKNPENFERVEIGLPGGEFDVPWPEGVGGVGGGLGGGSR